MSDQLELFSDEPFSLRLKIEEAMNIFWDNYWKHLPISQTTKAHKKRILTFFRGRFIDSISKTDVADFRRNLIIDEELSASTANHAQMLLGRMFSKLYEYKEGGMAHGVDYSKVSIPEKNPCTAVKKTKPNKRTQIATREQIAKLRYHADDDLTDILNMLLYTKLRPGDLQRITSVNVDLTRKRISGVQHKTITTRNPDGLPFMIPVVPAMEDILLPRLARAKPGSALFPFKNMQKRWRYVREQAGLMHLQLRDFRRTAATFLMDNGVDHLTVSQGLGHADLDMLPTYTPRTMIHQVKSVEMIVKEFE